VLIKKTATMILEIKLKRKSLMVLLLFSIVSCKTSQEVKKIPHRNLEQLNKKISGAFCNSVITQSGYEVKLSRFFRLYETDSVTAINSNKNQITVTFYDYLGKKRYKTFEGKFTRKFFQFHLDYETTTLPPLLIQHQEDRIRLSLDNEANLIINNYSASQGMLLFFGAGHSGTSQYQFNKN
jgi:hypothetical protein